MSEDRVDRRVDTVAETLFREQNRLVTAFEELDGSAFRRTPWQRDAFGRGQVCVLDGGAVLERAAVNVSVVAGTRLPPSITDSAPHLLGQPFRVTGLSMVVHPANPYAPACHANFRFFSSGSDWWFGGGVDLTPCYGFDEDATHFHQTLHDWCARHPAADYAAWKSACDSYFTLPHRDETRGVGGVFFDRVTGSFAELWSCVADGLATILPAYLPILRRRCSLPFTDRERRWQLLRRGRYVEFNLVHDRGTRFGLQTGADIDAVLVSMPPLAAWSYGVVPEPGSPEADLQRFLVPRDWLG
jgi:coproporphyrinogen III oxidase